MAATTPSTPSAPSTPPPAYRLSQGILNTISPPITLAYTWAAKYVPTPDRPLLDVSQGAPSTFPPQLLRETLVGVVGRGEGGGWEYCAGNGEKGLRDALVEEMKHVYGRPGGGDGGEREGEEVDVKEEDIAITAGSNLAFASVVMSLAGRGDEVILPVPWYFNHQMDLTLLGIKPVPLFTSPDDGFLPSIERCRALITDKTRAIALVTPNNPTGTPYPPSLIASFAQLAHTHEIALILDETYRDFIDSKTAPHKLFSPSSPLTQNLGFSWRSTLIHIFSFSKSYCIPGHRVGAIVTSPALLTHVRTVLDCLQICSPRPIQLALSTTLESLRPFVRGEAAALEARHKIFREHLPEGWVIGSFGGYFAFVRHPYDGVDAEEVSRRLAIEAGVITLPASFFSPGVGEGLREGWDRSKWIRFSVTNVDDEKIVQVCKRLRGWRP
ncbi:hypothetical protein AX17_003654 [Amanita inopinata Kibby_2008]|nr:hypothetical protein AX17_003654 [Amanita inopinata Kibby_2008]